MEEIVRVRLPRRGEILGEIEEVLGGSRLRVACKDGKTRLCRIPGKQRKRVTLKVGAAIIVKPWDIEPNEKADVVWIYNKTQESWLRKNGHKYFIIKKLPKSREFFKTVKIF